jgi:hypothetical protein
VPAKCSDDFAADAALAEFGEFAHLNGNLFWNVRRQ